MTAKNVSRRRAKMDEANRYDEPGEPVELPAGTSIPRQSIAEQIQQQIHIQLAKKLRGTSDKQSKK